MRLITNPGSNLPDSALARYDILLARQQIVVDHVAHDTRKDIPLALVDRWVAEAAEFPKVVGSTAQDMVPLFLDALDTDPELLVVTTSKRLIQTYNSSQAAAATVKSRVSHKNAHIRVVDTLSTDLGAGLLAIAAGEAMKAGRTLAEAANLLEAMAEQAQSAIHVPDLTHLHKSGRANFLKAWMATVLQVRPLVGLTDGDLRILGRVREKDDPITALAEHCQERLPGRPRVWLGIAHGGEPERAARSVAEFEQRFDVAFTVVKELSSSIYLYVGPGALAAFVVPVDGLPCDLPTPSPPFLRP